MQANQQQEQAIRDARLRLRISEALSQAAQTLPPQVGLNLRPLLQQGRRFLGSVSSAALRNGLVQVRGYLAQGQTADELLPMLETAQRNMSPVERIVAAPLLRPARKWLEEGDSAELAHWCGELREVIDEVLAEDELPALVMA